MPILLQVILQRPPTKKSRISAWADASPRRARRLKRAKRIPSYPASFPKFEPQVYRQIRFCLLYCVGMRPDGRKGGATMSILYYDLYAIAVGAERLSAGKEYLCARRGGKKGCSGMPF